jgi:hypothetical protein
MSLQLMGDLAAIQAWHHDIQENEIGLERARRLER